MGCSTSLTVSIARMIEPMPEGAAITLPVDWLRAVLADIPKIGGSPDFVADLTVEDAADKIGRRPSTVREWCRTGALEAYKLNDRDWRITRDALDAFQSRSRKREKVSPASSRIDIGKWRRSGA